MSFSVRNGRILPSIFMLLACLATGLFAQDNSGNIGGTILDPSGATVANAKITVTNTDRNQVVRIVSTDPTGSYSIPVIPVGIYSIRVEAAGFKTEDRTGVIVNVSDDLRFNFFFKDAATTEREGVGMAFLVALAVFVAAILVGVVLFVTGHVVLGLCALLASLPFALASWVKWADRGI